MGVLECITVSTKKKTRKKTRSPFLGIRVLHTKKQKNAEKKRGAHFWEVDVQSDLDFRNLVKTIKKNVVFLKNVKSLKKQKREKKRGADFGELDFCIPKK